MIKAATVVGLALVLLAITPWLLIVGSALLGDVHTYLVLVPVSIVCYGVVRLRDWYGGRRERRTTLERLPHDPRPAHRRRQGGND